MSSPGSVTRWFDPLLHGDPAAARALCERYLPALLELARRKLSRKLGIADEHDVANDALASFFRGLERGRFPDLHDRDNLWNLLVVLTARKAWHLLRDEKTPPGGWAPSGEHDLVQLPSPEPDPAFAAEIAENCERLLGQLGEPERTIALRKMEGFTNAEIAEQLDYAPRTIERKLRLIRGKWKKASQS